ncbi:MAG: PCRF domain-containing protein, partial [Oscillospiraceae bacterium]
MFEKLIEVKSRYEEINQLLMDPSVINDNGRYRSLMKEYKNLTPLIKKFDEFVKAKDNFEEAKSMLDEGGLDAEFKEVVQLQYEEGKEEMEKCSKELTILLLPKDDDDDRSVIIEIRGGAGGEEAALFAYNLYRMYNMYADTKGWKTEILSANETELGGFKEVSFSIEGDGV